MEFTEIRFIKKTILKLKSYLKRWKMVFAKMFRIFDVEEQLHKKYLEMEFGKYKTPSYLFIK